MPKANVYNASGQRVGELELDEAIFGAEVNASLLHSVVVMQLANRRLGTADTKTRAEVAGGGRKPWRQKGTGRARAGTIRSPLWRHGGIVFGPHPRDYSYTMPKKARRQAMRSALSSKVLGEKLILLEGLELPEAKTRFVAEILANLNVRGSALIVTGEADEKVAKAARNIAGVKSSMADSINVYDVLAHDSLVMTKAAVARVQEVLG